MNIKKIQELVKIMGENELVEVEIEQEGSKIRLIKSSGGLVQQTVIPAQAVPQVISANTAQAQPMAAPVQQESNENYLEVKSPMVGTFYAAPSPESQPFVKIGDTVNKGDVLCIVEAMKLMNEVKSEFSGKVAKILVENTEPVEFGQVMFLVEPV